MTFNVVCKQLRQWLVDDSMPLDTIILGATIAKHALNLGAITDAVNKTCHLHAEADAYRAALKEVLTAEYDLDVRVIGRQPNRSSPLIIAKGHMHTSPK